MPEPGQETTVVTQDEDSQITAGKTSQDGAAKIAEGLKGTSAKPGEATATTPVGDKEKKAEDEKAKAAASTQAPTITPEIKKIIDDAIAEQTKNQVKHFQSIADQQVAAANKRAKEAEAAAEKSRLDAEEKRIIAEFGDTPEAREKIRQERERSRLDQERKDKDAEIANREATASEGLKAKDALEIAKELGVDAGELMQANVSSKTEMRAVAEGMRNKALVTENEQLKKEIAELKKLPVQTPGGGNTLTGPDLKKMTPAEKIRYGIEHPESSKKYGEEEYK